CPVSVLSVSSAESLAALERGRSSGALAHAEIASAAVAADGTHYFNKSLKHASTHMTEVPLRTEGSSKLISALASQPLAVCSSGHRAISVDSRLSARDFTAMPKGTVGVEERMSVVWEKAVRTGSIDPMRFVAVTSTNAAKIFNLYPKKGRIAVGADADLVLWDASGRWKLTAAERQSSVDSSIYDEMTVHAQAWTADQLRHVYETLREDERQGSGRKDRTRNGERSNLNALKFHFYVIIVFFRCYTPSLHQTNSFFIVVNSSWKL
ncbi:Amidohydro-rel domain-containing protein, partial [Trichostrongylus colubriformis]